MTSLKCYQLFEYANDLLLKKKKKAVMISGLVRFTSPFSAHQEYLVGLLSPLIFQLGYTLMIEAMISCLLQARFCFCHYVSLQWVWECGGVRLRPLPLTPAVSCLLEYSFFQLLFSLEHGFLLLWIQWCPFPFRLKHTISPATKQ